MFRNTTTPTNSVKTRFSAYFVLIFTVVLLYSCDNVPTNSFEEGGPKQNEEITNPVPDSSATDTTDTPDDSGDSSDEEDSSDNGGDTPDGNDSSDGNDNTDEGSEDNPDEEPTTPPSSEFEFAIYDGMNLPNKPAAIANAGVKPLDVHYAGPIFGISARDLPGTMHLPDKEQVLKLARQTAQSGKEIGVIDIEHWPTESREGSSSEIQQSVENFKTVLSWFREGAPNVKWGYYGEMPIRNYWDSIESPSSSAYQGWQNENDNLQEVANEVDMLFPSVYTFYNRPAEWVKYAKAQISEAKRLNPDAKVIVYLWPVYHMSNKNGLAGQLIDADFWRLQLETVQEHADGVAIYLSSGFDFDTSHPWWQVTKDFIQDLEN